MRGAIAGVTGIGAVAFGPGAGVAGAVVSVDALGALFGCIEVGFIERSPLTCPTILLDWIDDL